ncbi:MAG: putative glycoside hydrolase [Gammaproteobacteria bacterium]
MAGHSMYRVLSLALCLVLAGCNSEDTAGPAAPVAQVNAVEPVALRVEAPPVIASPSQDSLAPPVMASPSEYSVVNDVLMEPPDEPADESPDKPPLNPSSFPVLIFSYLMSGFEPHPGEPDDDDEDDREQSHHKQAYSAFAHRLLGWFGRDRSMEQENQVGMHTDLNELPAYASSILRDTNGNRLYVDSGCTTSQCRNYADNLCSPAVRERRVQGMQEKLMQKDYRGFWLEHIHLAKPDGTLSTSNNRGEFVRPVDPDTNELMTNTQWNSCLTDWVEQVRDVFPAAELAHNSLWFVGQDEHARRQHLAADYIHLKQGFIDDRQVAGDGPYGFDSFLDYLDWAHSLGRTIIYGHDKSFMSEQEFNYALAAYFLVREGEDMFGINDASRTAPGNWDSRLDLDLGLPLGPRKNNGGSYTRDFECGSVTVWGPPERLGQITQTACE